MVVGLLIMFIIFVVRIVIIYIRFIYMIFLERIFSFIFGERVKLSVKRSRHSFVSDSSTERQVLVKEDTCVRVRSVSWKFFRF